MQITWLLLGLLALLPAETPAPQEMSPYDLDRVKVGSIPPDFTLEALDGSRVALSQFRGKKKVVLVFYRGYW